MDTWLTKAPGVCLLLINSCSARTDVHRRLRAHAWTATAPVLLWRPFSAPAAGGEEDDGREGVRERSDGRDTVEAAGGDRVELIRRRHFFGF